MVESSPPVLAPGNVWWQLAGLLQGVIARNCASQGVTHFELLHVVAVAVAAVTAATAARGEVIELSRRATSELQRPAYSKEQTRQILRSRRGITTHYDNPSRAIRGPSSVL